MNELKYNEEFPYAVVSLGEVKAYARYQDEAGVFASHYHEGEVIDTTPKPKIPEDADFLYWVLDGEVNMAYREGGDWFGMGEYWSDEDLSLELKDTDVTVLVRKEDK